GELETRVEEDLGIFNPLKEELAQVQSGFKEAVETELKSRSLKTELITNVSHDLKTPLTAIITYVDLLKDDTLSPEVRSAYVETLERKTRRLKQLIEDLFEISKAASGNVNLSYERVDLVQLLQQVGCELGDKIEASGIEFRWRLPDHPVYLQLDGQRSCRIFENLIVNITKYGLPRTRAYLAVDEQPDRVVVTLKNVSAQELDFDPQQITERFVRGDRARNTEGSGLGLAIAKSFTELQGGTFEILLDGDLFTARLSWPRE
ncbi:MAG TPA: sensor histidine kinase, partial [Candidatus Pygmaiobacter gallistercoris]|nr:sensor histidine kinase [Candidatus Pygmaiobacter gallistercoris]